jgi:dCMP deaminase
VTAVTRPDWDEYFLTITAAVAGRADCTRRRVGAIIVVDRRIVACGYNGAPAGQPGCLEGACPRGQHYYAGKTIQVPHGSVRTPDGWCACGNAWPCPKAVEPGSSYDTGPGACVAIHAEMNCLLFAGAHSRAADLYITDEPCDGCRKHAVAAGITRIITPLGRTACPSPRTLPLYLSLAKGAATPSEYGLPTELQNDD